jgi:hypothetical protein
VTDPRADAMHWLLVHSPLVGPMTWEPVAAELRRRGGNPRVARLTVSVDERRPFHESLADAAVAGIAPAQDDAALALVVHSGAGSLVPSIVERAARPIDAVVYVDAQWPHPGRNWLETAPPALADDLRRRAVAGRLPPWNEWFEPEALAAILPDAGLRSRFVAELAPVPMRWFEERAPALHVWRRIPSAYLRLSGAYAAVADRARAEGVGVQHLESDHLGMLTEPARVAEALASIVLALSTG